MNILLTGGTGFIGSHLVKRLAREEDHVYVLTRHPKQHQDTAFVSYISYNYPISRLPFIHAIVNLAGESIFGYWTEEKKEAILKSRIKTTEKLIHIMTQMETKPDVFISGSAIGYYGMADNLIFTENTQTSSDDFLASVVSEWEKTAQAAEDLGVRTVYTRFGVILDRYQGALPKMALPIQLFAGAKIGTGSQWLSWIHIDDCVRMLLFALENKAIAGPLNVTAPHPKQNESFTKILAHVLKRPALLSVPAPVLKTVLGQMHVLVTKGQYVLPKKAIDHDFTFQYPHLEDALKNLYP